MEVLEEKVHEDGSATYTFEMTDEEREVMTKQGILWCLVAGITGASPQQVLADWIAIQEAEENDL